MRTSCLLLSTAILAITNLRADGPPPFSELITAVPANVSPTTYPVAQQYWLIRADQKIKDAAARANEIKIIFDGDSITDSWENKGRAVWQSRLMKYHPFDFAMSGDRTQHVLFRLAEGQARGLDPKLIVLLIGTNNIPIDKPEQIADGVAAIIKVYRERCPNAVILLQGIFPRSETPDAPNRVKIKETNALLTKLADGTKVVYVDFGDKFLEPDGRISSTVLYDYLHPTPKGYTIWADALQPFIDKYVQ